jgi:hypothetical protein
VVDCKSIKGFYPSTIFGPVFILVILECNYEIKV